MILGLPWYISTVCFNVNVFFLIHHFIFYFPKTGCQTFIFSQSTWPVSANTRRVSLFCSRTNQLIWLLDSFCLPQNMMDIRVQYISVVRGIVYHLPLCNMSAFSLSCTLLWSYDCTLFPKIAPAFPELASRQVKRRRPLPGKIKHFLSSS